MATKKKAAVLTDEKKMLLVTMNDGKERRFIVPKTSRVTFCPGIPGNMSGKLSNTNEYALRIYGTSKEDLIAVIAGVRDFRESTVQAESLVIREAGQTLWKSDENGFKTETSVNYERQIIPDHKHLIDLE